METAEAFGKEGTEIAQGFQPMPDSEKEREQEALSVNDAAQELGANFPGDEPTVVTLYNVNGEPLPENASLDAEHAARLLAERRHGEAVETYGEINKAVAEIIDESRKQQAEPNAEQPEAEAQAEQQPADANQPEAQQEAATGDDILQNPKVKEAIDARVSQFDNARAQYEQAAIQLGEQAALGFFASFPELAGLNPQQIQGAIHTMRAQNPARVQQIEGHFRNLQAIQAQQEQIRQRQSQEQEAHFNAYGAEQDAKFAQAIFNELPATVQQVKSSLVDVARDIYGVDPKDLAQLYATNPVVRSAPFQRMMYDAVKLHAINKQLASSKQRPSVPGVIRPGTARDRGDRYEAEVSSASKRFGETGSVEDGAKFLLAKRRAAR